MLIGTLPSFALSGFALALPLLQVCDGWIGASRSFVRIPLFSFFRKTYEPNLQKQILSLKSHLNKLLCIWSLHSSSSVYGENLLQLGASGLVLTESLSSEETRRVVLMSDAPIGRGGSWLLLSFGTGVFLRNSYCHRR